MFEMLKHQLKTWAPLKKKGAKGPGVLREMFPEASDLDLHRLAEAAPFTMTSPERLWALRGAVKYVVERGVPGDFAETGVWRGGSSMLIAYSLLDLGASQRNIWLYDTFEGMPAPSERDVQVLGGETAQKHFEAERTGEDSSAWCNAPLDEVRANMAAAGHPPAQTKFVIGKTQLTLAEPSNRPERLALLRLDTDWYESTRAELEHMFDLLSPGGVLIVDDYGHWAGCMRAVDEFFAAREQKYLLNRIDYTGRMMVKA